MILFGLAIIRYEAGPPDRCPNCGSYRLDYEYQPGSTDTGYMILCEACSWRSHPAPEPPPREDLGECHVFPRSAAEAILASEAEHIP